MGGAFRAHARGPASPRRWPARGAGRLALALGDSRSRRRHNRNEPATPPRSGADVAAPLDGVGDHLRRRLQLRRRHLSLLLPRAPRPAPGRAGRRRRHHRLGALSARRLARHGRPGRAPRHRGVAALHRGERDWPGPSRRRLAAPAARRPRPRRRRGIGRARAGDVGPRMGTGPPRGGRGLSRGWLARPAPRAHGVGAQQRAREGRSRSPLRRPGAARSRRDGHRGLSARTHGVVPEAHRVPRDQSEGRALPARHVHHARRRPHHHRDGRAGHGRGRIPRARPHPHAGEARSVGSFQPGALGFATTATGSIRRCGARASPPTTSLAGPRRDGRRGPRAGSSSTTSSVARGWFQHQLVDSFPGAERGERVCVARTSSWRA